MCQRPETINIILPASGTECLSGSVLDRELTLLLYHTELSRAAIRGFGIQSKNTFLVLHNSFYVLLLSTGSTAQSYTSLPLPGRVAIFTHTLLFLSVYLHISSTRTFVSPPCRFASSTRNHLVLF